MSQNEIIVKAEAEKEDSLSSLELEKQKESPIKTSYILKYIRKKNELAELIKDTNLPKAKHCLFKLDLILLKNNNESNESLLQIKCHEIGAVHFEDYYERIYSYNDIIKENRYFKALDNIEDIKESIDYVLIGNFKNNKKIFLKIENKSLNIHINLTFFDTIKEIIFNIPKRELNEEEKILFLPMALKEIQHKMHFYEKENKKYKIKVVDNDIKDIKNNNNKFYEYYLKIEKPKKEKDKEKEKEEENNKSCQQSLTNDTSHNISITSDEKNKKMFKTKKKKKIRKIKKEEKDRENRDDDFIFENIIF